MTNRYLIIACDGRVWVSDAPTIIAAKDEFLRAVSDAAIDRIVEIGF